MSPNLLGALMMMGSMAAFTINDTCIKVAGGSLPLFQLVTLRGLLTSALIFLLARRLGSLHFHLSRRDWVLIAVRCGAEVGATVFFLTALMHMPLANLTAVLQVLPLTVTLGAALFFGEAIGWRRMLAILVGFCGMLLIVRPGPEGFSLDAAYALASVVCVTVRDLVTRRMSAQVPTLTVTLASALSVTVFAAFASASTDWVPVDADLAILIGMASVFVMVGYVFSVRAMRIGDVSFIAPFRYTGLLWALLLGWLVFDHWPTQLTMIGAGIVVATGLFTLYRERALLRG